MKDTTDNISIRIEFLNELKSSAAADLRSLEETIKRVEGFSFGCKDVAEKFEKFVAKNQSEYAALATEGKLHQSVVNLMSNNSTAFLSFIKENAIEAEKMLCIRRGELMSLKARIQSFDINLEGMQKKLLELEAAKNAPPAGFSEALQEHPQRVRPDQDETTRIGKAAADLKRRRASKVEKEPAEFDSPGPEKSKKKTKKSTKPA